MKVTNSIACTFFSLPLFSLLVDALTLTLFNSPSTGALNWVTSQTGSSGWVENSMPITGQRYYFVCSISSQTAPNNWLRLPFISKAGANLVYVQVTFSVRSCSAAASSGARYCNQFISLYNYDSDSDNAMTYSNGSVSPAWSSYSLVGKLVPDTPWTDSAVYNVKTLTFSPSKLGFYLAFQDTGSCSGIANITVYYNACPATTYLLAQYPQTPSASSIYQFVTVTGSCLSQATAVPSFTPNLPCMGDGTWQPVSAAPASPALIACRCNPGFETNSNFTSCNACNPGYYKDSSLYYCTTCPAMSNSAGYGSASCACVNGYYRTVNESASTPCTTTPSAPTNVVANPVSGTTVQLMWQDSASFGGRQDNYYTVSVTTGQSVVGDQYSAIAYCSSSSSVQRVAVATYVADNLTPGVSYNVVICACNGVTLFSQYANCAKTSVQTIQTNINATVQPYTTTTQPVLSTAALQSATTSPINASTSPIVIGVAVGLAIIIILALLGVLIIHILRLQKSPKMPCFDKQKMLKQNESGGTGVHNEGFAAMESPAINSSPLRSPDSGVSADASISNNSAYAYSSPTVSVALATPVTGGIGRGPAVATGMEMGTWSTTGTMTHFSPGSMNQFGKTNVATAAPMATDAVANGKFRNSTYADAVLMAREIPMKNIIVESVIGCGEFGEVCKGRLALRLPNGAKTDRFVAVKTLKVSASDGSRNEFLAEASIMCLFDHENILRLEGVVTKSHPLMIVSEYMDNGALDSFLRANDGRLSSYVLIQMIQGVASGMDYLASKSYVHRDLAARNILVNKRLVCKIGDFGLSRQTAMLDEESSYGCYMTRGGKIPIRWTAPEALLYRKFTTESDVWSFGILMWEVLGFGARPYWDWSNNDVVQLVEVGYRLPPPFNCPEVAYSAMIRCWQYDRHERPGFESLFSLFSSWLQDPNLLKRNAWYTPARFGVPESFEATTITSAHVKIKSKGNAQSFAMISDIVQLPETVSGWLQSLELINYKSAFDAAQIFDLTAILPLTLADFERLGVKKPSDLKKLLTSVQSMQIFRSILQQQQQQLMKMNGFSPIHRQIPAQSQNQNRAIDKLPMEVAANAGSLVSGKSASNNNQSSVDDETDCSCSTMSSSARSASVTALASAKNSPSPPLSFSASTSSHNSHVGHTFGIQLFDKKTDCLV